MMRYRSIVLAATLITSSHVANAQDQMGEIIVTAQRSSGEYYSDDQTVIGLRRQADSAVQRVSISSDSRDETQRKREIHAMLLAAIDRAGSAGVQLVTGEFELVPVTRDNYRDILFEVGNRPDTSRIDLMVKAKLSESVGTAQKRIHDFIRAVPPDGRALMERNGSLTLTIVNPDQYRDEIAKLVAAEAKRYASYFGSDYGVEVGGLSEQLYWSQVSNTEVFLYIPYRFSVRPR